MTRGMKRREFTVALAAGALIGRSALAATPTMQEVASLADKVKAGGLPPVDKRIPTDPSIVDVFYGGEGPGRNGGDCNMLIANARDTRLMTLYSNARLIVYDDKLNLHPDILSSYEAKEGREFTLKLRAGHKWSDGHPFTTEDFRYFWEDIANNKELSAWRSQCRADGPRRAAQGRHRRRADHPLHLGQAQPLLHHQPGPGQSAVAVPARALPQAVPHQVQLARGDRQARQGRPGPESQLGADP